MAAQHRVGENEGLCVPVCALVLALAGVACAPALGPASAHPEGERAGDADEFLTGLVRTWPADGSGTGLSALAVSSRVSQRVSSYDNALLALYRLRRGERELAGQLLQALAALQREDGSIPFTFHWPKPEADNAYVRSGAVAWVGYAAVEYLDADRAGPAREAIIQLAHGVAKYLMARQLASPGDPRDGLVLGGTGAYELELIAGETHERYTPGEVAWASTEHNIDAYFFLRDFAKLTGEARFSQAAQRIAAALLARGFSAEAGQLVQGLSQTGADKGHALDCASWGALFLRAAGDSLRAETALGSAEWRYLSREPASGALGHKPYAHASIIANPALAAHFGDAAVSNWDQVEGVWPEGSAGVALANLRLGRRRRAEEILAQLEKLRASDGGLPTFTAAVPLDFDRLTSLAGTVWIELVRYELAHETETLWRR